MSVKAFDLVPAIERVCWTENIKTVIECLECCGKNLYVGTQGCFIIHYILEEKSHPDGNVVFTSKKQSQKYLEYKKPVTLLKAISALNRILVLCDGNLAVLNMFDLEFMPAMSKLKGISYFCVNENPAANNPFSVEICLAKRKQLQICHVTDDKLIHLKDISTPEPPLVMAMDGNFVCAALPSKYVIINTEQGYVQELFPYENELNHPLVKRITKEEFLLVGPSALGMFVTTAGISERPPLPWGENIMSVAYSHPYLIVLSSEFLTVFSILDQQPKQRIAFRGGCCLDNFDGKVYVASTDIICALLPVPWEKQVQALLSDKKVGEALELAKYSNKAGLSKDLFKKIFQRIQQQAGFIEFSQFHFEEAKELFQEGHLDVRELISIFPGLLPADTMFVREVPALHDVANINEMCSTSLAMIPPCKEFLLHLLEEVRGSTAGAGCKLEVDTAVLKLYAEMDSRNLIPFINSVDTGCHAKESVDSLQKYEQYHALAIFHSKLGENDKALVIWSRLVTGEYTDPSFPGLTYVIDFLSRLNDHQLVWKYADFVLERDQEHAVKIFIDRPANQTPSERLRPELISDYLHRFPAALICYLEHLVFEKKLEKEKFHTHLAVLYLDRVLQILKLPETEQGALQLARKKLQQLLHSSSLYRVQLLLGKALESQLHMECSILYGKLEEHEKALRILVHKLQNHQAAEEYCLQMSSEKDRRFRHRLFHTLLGVYLDPSMSQDEHEEMLAPAVQLLNSELAEFDVVKVLHLIPAHWSVALLDQFLNKALRSSLHRKYCCRIESALARGENLQVKFAKIHLESTSVIMTEDRVCAVCKRPFVEPGFARYPNGIITHPQCAKQHIICPDSGKAFVCQKSNIR